MEKQGIGLSVILVGIAIIGYVWFKRNKPTTAKKQEEDLKVVSNEIIGGGAKSIDKPFQYSITQTQNQDTNPYVMNTVDIKYDNLSPKEKEDLRKAIGNIPDPSAIYSGQVVINNSSLNQLSNYDFSKVDWSNIKI